MKMFLFCLISLIVMHTQAVAKQHPVSLQNAEKNYLTGLDHFNAGVVNSTITRIMVLKLFHPNKDYTHLSQKLDSLSIKSADKTIRLKAFIASNYLKHPERFNWIEKKDYENATAFFKLYSTKLEAQLKRTQKSYTLRN